MYEEYGDLVLWQEVIQDLKAEAKKAKKLTARIRLAKSLNNARGYLKYAESKILVILVLAILFVSGCQTLKGVTGDTGWMLTKLSENINTEKE